MTNDEFADLFMEYFDKEGDPISHQTWMELFQDADYRRVAVWRGENGARISTVWSGIGQILGPSGPMIFETLSYCPGEGEEVYKYSTLEEAIASHDRLVELAQTNPQYISGEGLVVDDDTPEDRWEGIIQEND